LWILDLSPIRRGLRVSGVGVWNAKSLHLCPADFYAIGEANYSARDSTCIFPALSRYEFQAERFRELRVPGARRSPSAPKIHATSTSPMCWPLSSPMSVSRSCRPGARRDDHGTQDVCRIGVSFLLRVAARNKIPYVEAAGRCS